MHNEEIIIHISIRIAMSFELLFVMFVFVWLVFMFFLLWCSILLVVRCWVEAISVCNHITCVSKLSYKFIDGVAAQPRPVSSSRRLLV